MGVTFLRFNFVLLINLSMSDKLLLTCCSKDWFIVLNLLAFMAFLPDELATLADHLVNIWLRREFNCASAADVTSEYLANDRFWGQIN